MDASILNQKKLIQAALGAWRQAGEQHLIPISGYSMHPLLRPGDQVIVTHDLDTLRPGDIILFWDTQRLIVHRLLRIDATSAGLRFVAKGDNRLDSDPPVAAEALVGRVRAIRRGERLLSLETPLWRWLGRLLAAGGRAWLRLLAWAGDQPFGGNDVSTFSQFPPFDRLRTQSARGRGGQVTNPTEATATLPLPNLPLLGLLRVGILKISGGEAEASRKGPYPPPLREGPGEGEDLKAIPELHFGRLPPPSQPSPLRGKGQDRKNLPQKAPLGGGARNTSPPARGIEEGRWSRRLIAGGHRAGQLLLMLIFGLAARWK